MASFNLNVTNRSEYFHCIKNEKHHIANNCFRGENISEILNIEAIVFWIYAIYFPVAEFVSLILQFGLLITFCKSVKLRKPRFYFITSLALGDIVWITIITPVALATVYTGRYVFTDTICKVQGYLLYVLALQTKLTLALVTYDRHQAICKAVQYRQFVTSKKYLILCIFGWLYPCMLALPPLMGWNSYTLNLDYFLCHISWDGTGFNSIYIYLFIGAGLVFPCYVAFVVFYVKIFLAARQTYKSVTNASHNRPFHREVKVAKGVALVFGVYFISSLPLTVIKYVEMFVGKTALLTCLAQITHLFFTIPHFINPLIYGWMNREFKEEFFRLWNYKQNKSIYQSRFRERLGTGTSVLSERSTSHKDGTSHIYHVYKFH